MRAMAVGVSNTLCHSGNKIQLLRAPCCVCQGRGRVWCFGGYLLLQTGRQQHVSALVHKVIGYKAKAYRERNPCTALRVSSSPSSLLCSTFSLLQGYGASVKPYCLLLILLGELEKVEAQDPPAITSSCTAQPVFPLALPTLLRALPWEGAGKLSCLGKPWLLSQHRLILHLCFHPTLPKYSCSQNCLLYNQ